LEHWDEDKPGFGVRITDQGSKSWQIMYRHGGKLRRMTLGAYPKIGLADARKLATKAFVAVAEGRDPAGEKAAGEGAGTIRVRFGEWMDADQASNRSAEEVRRLFERDVIPKIGDKIAADVPRRDLIEIVNAKKGQAPIMANRLLAHLKRFFAWMAGQDIIAVNIARDMERPSAEVSRARALIDKHGDASELAEVWNAADAEGYPFGTATKLLILTGARRQEVLDATKSEIQGEYLSLAAERVKTAVERDIYLSKFAREIIASEVPEHKGFVFSGTKGAAAFQGVSKAFERLCDRITEARAEVAIAAGVDPDDFKTMPAWRLHDLRRTFATGLQQAGTRLEVTEEALGHRSGSRSGIRAVYQRWAYAPEIKLAVEAWGERVRTLVS
jgi:integrase